MKKQLIILFFLASILLFSGCSKNRKQASIDEILNTDKAFSKLSEEKGMKHAFLEFADDAAVILRKNSYPQIGKAKMEDRFATFSDTGFTLKWEPQFADAACSGELGYSYGIYTMTGTDSVGDHMIEQGTYVSVWKKDKQGHWKYVLDTGNEGLGEQE